MRRMLQGGPRTPHIPAGARSARRWSAPLCDCQSAAGPRSAGEVAASAFECFDGKVEPVSIITSLGVAFARGAGGKLGSGLAAQLGLSSTESIAARLSGIESRLAALEVQPHRENLRRGIVLLRESAYQPDPTERNRRLRVAEDHLVVSATDAQLGYDDRASAALLAAVSSAERGSQADALRWLWACNSLLCAFVGDRLHHQASILAETTPTHIRADLDRQERNTNAFMKFMVGHRPAVAPLRHRLRTEAHEVLPVWAEVRAVLGHAVAGTVFPEPTITNETGTYLPGLRPEGEWTQLNIAVEAQPGIPTAGGGAVVTITTLKRAGERLKIAGNVHVPTGATVYRRPVSGLVFAQPRPSVADGPPTASITIGGGGLPGYSSGHIPPRVGTLMLHGLADGASFLGDFKIDRPFDVLRLWTSECAYTVPI